MAELPTGTVTFLFTDVEGSTRLLRELGAEAYEGLVKEHRRTLRRAFAAHHGVEVDTQGDAFFVAFASAREAAAAAADARVALEPGPIRVRMGLHTGEAIAGDEGYVGIDVHRAARIAAAGHGGQVLVSQSTRELIDSDLRDLGAHRLKDLSAPERLYQLGGGDFPPLKTLYQTNLPVPATPFLGRAGEIAELTARLADDEVRLLTLTGPGGTGKTRLAMQAAAELAESYEHGVWWVPLAALRDSRSVLDRAARALGAKRELAAHIGSRRLLLLLDNFEHVLEAGAGVAELLRTCPQLNVLVTSREPLHVAGEWEYAVDPLQLEEAIVLFRERARAVTKDFSANGEVGEICRRVDCLPLAVELAAARVKVLPPAKILERLDQRLPLLVGGSRDVPERQRTLRATIEWSYELLNDDEQQLFARLAVFSGGCTLEAAEEVCGADLDTLTSLVDKSLVRRTGDRFWMLETIRELAAEFLDSGPEAEELRRLHAAHFISVADRMESELIDEDNAVHAAAARRWRERAAAEYDNFRSAHAWLVSQGDRELALRLVGSASWKWDGGSFAETWRLLDMSLSLSGSSSPATEARALQKAGDVARDLGDYQRSEELLVRSLSLARSIEDPRQVAWTTSGLGESVKPRDPVHARHLFQDAIALFRDLSSSRGLSRAIHSLGELERDEGNYELAVELLEESLSLSLRAPTPEADYVRHGLADLYLELGEIERASGLYRAALEHLWAEGERRGCVCCIGGLAAASAAAGRLARAARLWGAAEGLQERLGFRLNLSEQARYERRLTVLAEAKLGPETTQGRALSLEEAVAYALSID